MSFTDLLRRRRQRRAHERYLHEREQREAQQSQDTEEKMRELSNRASGWGGHAHGP